MAANAQSRPWPERVVWIIGASAGIGRELAIFLNAMGARVIISSRNRKALNEFKQDSQTPDTIAIVPVDLSKSFNQQRLVETAIHCFGVLDTVVYMAGVSQRAPALDTAQHVFDHIMHVNFIAAQKIAQAVVPYLIQRNGHLALVSSVAAYISTPGRSAYSASKSALHSYFESLYLELRHAPIRITMFTVGFARTKISQSALTADGSAYNRHDRNQLRGISAQKCARHIARGMSRRRFEYFVGLRLKGRIAYTLWKFAPAFLRACIK